jgi:translation initiation factor IF-2
MPETANKSVKGIQISKIAKEVNRQSSEILEYLKRINIKVEGIMSKVDEDVYNKVLSHFKSDKEEAEKHKQKLIDLKKKHSNLEIQEIENEIKKDKERQLKIEEERKRKEEESERLKAERQKQLEKELEEKRKLLKQKEESERLEKIRREEERKKAEAENKIAESEKKINEEKLKAAESKKTQGKKLAEDKKKGEDIKKSPVKEQSIIKITTEKKETEQGKHIVKKPDSKKAEQTKQEDKKTYKEHKKPEHKHKDFQTKKQTGNFERVTLKDDYHKLKKHRQAGKSPYKKTPDRIESKIKEDKAQEPKQVVINPETDQKKRDIDKSLKSKKHKYLDGAELRKKKKLDDEVIDQEIQEAIRETMAKMDDTGLATSRQQLRKKKKKERLEQEQKEQQEILARANVLQVTEFVSTSELAALMGIDVSQLIQKCFELGIMVTINQRLDKDIITLLADEYGYKIEFQKEYEVDILADKEDDPSSLMPRPPVVTIMGHVDHGKTSLLDYIRKANVVAGEAGGITQHIGAYQVKLDDGRLITFLDTPGHEAFTAMRARGAQITDIVVLVVAADDSVMPQTVEAINHALAANVPIIVAINKIDKPNADPTRIKTQLSEKGILIEEWGGKYQSVEISAKNGTNVDSLLEKILVEAEILELKANPNRPARGAIVEAKLDKGKGITATVLVQKGTLKTGDVFVAGIWNGKIKAMFDERGNKVQFAKPSTPVQVLGFDGMPQAGDVLIVLNSEREAKEIALKRQQLRREQEFRQVKFITLDDISKQIKEGRQVDLNVIIKGDVDGSVEALSDSLLKLATSEVKVSIIHKAIGEITEQDVLLASASSAIIIGFNVRPNLKARKLAEAEKVDIRIHNIIYDVINEVKLALEGLLEPEKKEEILATVEVRETFKVPKIGTVAGCYVADGKIVRNNKVRLLRDGFVIFDGNINALKRFKDDVREVEQGFECGISLENFNDIKIGDIIESYTIKEIKRKLELK